MRVLGFWLSGVEGLGFIGFIGSSALGFSALGFSGL